MLRDALIRFTVLAALAAATVTGCSLGPDPKADFDVSTRAGVAPLAVQFTDRSDPGGAAITKYTWYFGDGTTSDQASPLHTYQEAGTYTVSMRVETKIGSSLKEKDAFILVSPSVSPNADFQGAPRAGQKPLSVQFTDQSHAGTSPITSRTWSFGDGQSSTETNPVHVYQNDGVYDVSLVVQNAAATDTTTKAGYVVVSTLPVAAFSGTPRSGLKPLSVQFTDQSSPGTNPITAWSWSFGDGGASTSQSPAHTYTTAGTYTVSLTVTTASGNDSEVKTGYVVVSDPVQPVAAFSGSPRSGTIPLTAQFTDQSTAGSYPITAWSWSFGDGGTSTAKNPSHTYTVAGDYTVTLTVTTAAGADAETGSGYVVAADPVKPTAAFAGTPTSGNIPLNVQFTDQSSAGSFPITAWSWAFGDGATSTAQNPSHTYAAAGVYTVSLSVTTSAGSDGATKTNYINATQAPVAAFNASPKSGNRPLPVQFTDQSTAGSSPITAWSWNFGDGGTSASQNPSHAYAAAGAYTVTLTVTTAAGSDGETKPAFITVTDPPVPPTAAFVGAPRTGNAPLNVQFTDQSTPGTFPITSWSWNFGDGGTSTAQNPSHSYAATGTYTVTLNVTTTAGTDGDTKTGYVVVTQPPTAAFDATPKSGDRPLSVQFTDQSTPGTSPITSWSWNFGDGGTSTAQNPTHGYATAGTYGVTLTVTTAAGSDAEVKPAFITVTDPPVAPTAAFTGTPRFGVAPLDVQFTDQSTAGTAPITAWSWTFGDGGTSTAANPLHHYAAAGTYDVTLSVTSTAGSDTTTQTGYVVVTQPPAAAFDAAPKSGEHPLTVQFTDQSTAGSAPITSWSWTFGDGASSTVQNPSHVYNAAGTYDVALTVTTADGNDVATKPGFITVTNPPVPPAAEFSASTTSGGTPLAVTFTDLSTPGTSPITSWAWTFGDGGTSTESNPTHTYTLPGTYNVALSVTTADGTDTMTKNGYVTACLAPTADFVSLITSGTAPFTAQFTDLSTSLGGAITSHAWNFGDGGTSTEASPSHTYTAPGTYDVSLTVSTDCAADTTVKAGYVSVQDPCTNVTYSIADASFELRADNDADGCADRARIHFDANVTATCSKSVFAKVLLRPKGTTDWAFTFTGACFTISGASAADSNFVVVQNVPQDTYEIRVELYECNGATPVATRDYVDDPDLDNHCIE